MDGIDPEGCDKHILYLVQYGTSSNRRRNSWAERVCKTWLEPLRPYDTYNKRPYAPKYIKLSILIFNTNALMFRLISCTESGT